MIGAGLIISLAMLDGKNLPKWTGWMGLLVSILLLAGDFGTGLSPNNILAVSTGIGYGLLTIWLLVVGRRLFQVAG